MLKTTSDASATAAGESAHSAPRRSSGAARSRVRVWTTSGWPASARCPDIDCPNDSGADPADALHAGTSQERSPRSLDRPPPPTGRAPIVSGGEGSVTEERRDLGGEAPHPLLEPGSLVIEVEH